MSTKFYNHSELRPFTDDRLKYSREQVIRLANIHQPEQRSPEWYEFRDGMLTASDWGTILGMNPYSNSNQLLLKKCGKQIPFPSNAAIDWGVKYEDVAVLIYEKRNNVNVMEFGCLQHPTVDFLGASPDGITPDGIMLEIKCPSKRAITGVVPSYYWAQVQAQLEVCELDRCDFLECGLSEYLSKDDYLEDNFEKDFSKNSMGTEKGCVLEFLNKITKKFEFRFSPIGIIGEELEEWIDNTNKKALAENDHYLPAGPTFWKLDKISCVPVYRNQEWFNEAHPKLEAFWNEILEWRKIGLPALEEKLNAEKDERKRKREEKRSSTLKKKNEKLLAKESNRVYIDLDISSYVDDADKSPEIDIEGTNKLISELKENKCLFNYKKSTEQVSLVDSSKEIVGQNGFQVDLNDGDLFEFNMEHLNLKDLKSGGSKSGESKNGVNLNKKSLFDGKNNKSTESDNNIVMVAGEKIDLENEELVTF